MAELRLNTTAVSNGRGGINRRVYDAIMTRGAVPGPYLRAGERSGGRGMGHAPCSIARATPEEAIS